MKKSINAKPEIVQHYLIENDHFPNNPYLPLLIYKNVFNFSEDKDAEMIEEVFAQNEWTNSWRNGIYDYHHYHSNTHEVLGVYSGHCIVQFGGDHGVTKELRTGDVVIIPAGVAHKKIAGEKFKCVGAYPNGKDYNIHVGKPGEKEETKKEIAMVTIPDADPVLGEDGPLRHYWSKETHPAEMPSQAN
jgi:uncharacterized protein YjlB